jgi:hypothetical protein
MSDFDDWPLPAETPDWWATWATLTDAQKDAMAQAYALEQMAAAQSDAAFDANVREHRT